MQFFITLIYAFCLLYIFLFSLGQLHLTWIYRRGKRSNSHGENFQSDFIPYITIQLPVFNEKYVVERLLDAVSQINYPKDKFEIQLLDDSTDETTNILLRKIESMRSRELNITLIHREKRTGFKAGALDHGLKSVKGEFIAIFDADFIPQQDFLQKTIPHFIDSRIGVVQTRWGHINRDYSLLTQLQAFGLDAHFSIEQSARSASGSFINFNGTCGVWRKQCIMDAGGWKFDTLTEDLDLSYRAQLKGWRFQYLEDVATPGELPVIMPAIKSQQYRWNKGGAETARKMFGSVMRSGVSTTNKVHAFFHLFNSTVFLCLLLAALLSVPMLFIKARHPEIRWLFNLGTIFLLGFLSVAMFYWTSTRRFYKHPRREFIKLFPAFIIVSMGLALHNGVAVMEGLLGRKTAFIRTPKFNVSDLKESWKGNHYADTSFNWMTLLEGILCLYFISGIVAGFYLHDGGLMFFHFMLTLGFGAVFYYSVKPALNV